MSQDQCKRCGECCRSGGPALHLEDLDLIRSGVIPASALITFRAGEYVHDQPAGGLITLESEIVKIRGREGGWTCLFYGPEASTCAIYENRPAECRALKCWDTSGLEAMYAADRVTRADILGPGAMEIVAEHERRCPVGRAVSLAHAGRNLELEAMYRYDFSLRVTLAERGASPEEIGFLLGRELKTVVDLVLNAGRG